MANDVRAIRAYAAVLLLACCPTAYALNPSLDITQYAHARWTVRDGLFKGMIYAIAQTPDGYLWLGTEFGLLRFDGVRSVPWQPPGGEHFSSGTILALLTARDGRLWIGSNRGIAGWKDGKLTLYPELAGVFVQTLLEDREGAIWAGGSGSPGRLCAIQGSSVQCYGEDGSLGFAVLSLYEDKGGTLWAGAASGLWRWKPGPPKVYAMAEQEIRALISGDDGAFLISMRGAIKQFVNGKTVGYPIPGAGRKFNPDKLLRDRNGGLWIGTSDRGLLHVHEGRTDLFGRSQGLSSDYTLRLFEDREGDIWVATLDGLDRFREFAVPTISVEQGLPATFVSVVAARDGKAFGLVLAPA